MSVTANGSTVFTIEPITGTGPEGGWAPWAAARAMGDLPVQVLAHGVRSGQVPEGVWFLARLADGRRVLRYDVQALQTWTATRPHIDPSKPPLPCYTAGHTAVVPPPRGES